MFEKRRLRKTEARLKEVYGIADYVRDVNHDYRVQINFLEGSLMEFYNSPTLDDTHYSLKYITNASDCVEIDYHPSSKPRVFVKCFNERALDELLFKLKSVRDFAVGCLGSNITSPMNKSEFHYQGAYLFLLPHTQVWRHILLDRE